jgi:hypothetical protein
VAGSFLPEPGSTPIEGWLKKARGARRTAPPLDDDRFRG